MHSIAHVGHMNKRMSVQEVERIAERSRRNNAADGLTGRMMFNGGCFCQRLEGPKDKPTLRYRKIADDPRHGNSRVVQSVPTERQAFADSMGLLGLEDLSVRARESVFSLRKLFPVT